MGRIRWKICVYRSNPLVYSNKSCADARKIVILSIFLDWKFTDQGTTVFFSWYLPKWNLISEAKQYVPTPHDYQYKYWYFCNETLANNPEHYNFAFFHWSHLFLTLFFGRHHIFFVSLYFILNRYWFCFQINLHSGCKTWIKVIKR